MSGLVNMVNGGSCIAALIQELVAFDPFSINRQHRTNCEKCRSGVRTTEMMLLATFSTKSGSDLADLSPGISMAF